MRSLETSFVVEARLAWALLWIALVIFLFALVWGFLNPHFYTLTDQASSLANSTTDGSPAAQTGIQRVTWTWKLAPFWVALGVLFWGYRRALNEAKRNP